MRQTILTGSLAALILTGLAGVSSAAVNFFDPTDTATVPKLLSQTGIYTNIATKTLDPALHYFEVNAPLWSDASQKDRWIVLPPGKTVAYVDTTDVFAYPESTLFVKLFRHDTVTGDSGSRVYWETRLLLKKTTDGFGNWHGFSYKWNAAGTEAHLVDPENGLDTVLTLAQPQGYRKWHFPSRSQCNACHRVNGEARGVLGFFPAQLKRPSRANPSVNQVTALFNAGVFSGTQPDPADLARRWKGVHEPIPTGLTPDERFRVLDTMARSYIAANCSGCHGAKGLEEGATNHAEYLNYDVYNLYPVMEFGNHAPGGWGLTVSDEEMIDYPTEGRARFLTEVSRYGMDTSPGGVWNMSRPGDNEAALVKPGFPAYSVILYRQWARRNPGFDSLQLRSQLQWSDPQGWNAWIFNQPWGTKAWRDALAAHSVPLSEVLAAAGAFDSDQGQMPPLATFIPDTAALKILGEWAKHYRTLHRVEDADSVVRLRGLAAAALRGNPRVQNRLLIVPEGWTGTARMAGFDGRAYPLVSAGKGRYALPASVPPGIYVFRIGNRTFKASVLK